MHRVGILYLQMIPVIVLLLVTCAGALTSLGMLLIGRGALRPDSRLVPAFCRMEEGACRRVVQHPHARLLGVPNALVGLLYYCGIAGALVAGDPVLMDAARAAAWLAVAAGAGLGWSLLTVVRAPCPLCWTAHGVNLVLALLLTV
jgi:uncharacterized membrane protein